MMRIQSVLAAAGLIVCSAMPAFAQTSNTQTQYVPLYNAAGPVYYTNQAGGALPIYNNTVTAPPMPIEQMVAGKNAPSYNYNQSGTRPYNFGAQAQSTSNQGMMTSEQAAAYHQQFLNNMAQQQQPAAVTGSNYSNNAYSPFGNTEQGFTGTTQQPPRQRKVVYNERNNPLTTPPRLFNPDQ